MRIRTSRQESTQSPRVPQKLSLGTEAKEVIRIINMKRGRFREILPSRISTQFKLRYMRLRFVFMLLL